MTVTDSIFTRSPLNPILTPSGLWWERKGVLNPGVALHEGRVTIVYRAVGGDGISRFGLAWSADGERITDRLPVPWYEGALDDPYARLGVEDPRITPLEDDYYLTYCKASVESADTPPLYWEFAPFRVRSGIGRTHTFSHLGEVGIALPEENTKDTVLFPRKIGGRYAALTRIFPSIQYITSPDLQTWSDPVTVLEPIPGTWEGERVGAGPPPIPVERGWLLLYHANEYLNRDTNARLYRMGLAVLDRDDPCHVLYRHPRPIFSPEAPYEVNGPVGNVVFGTGLVLLGDSYHLYYGAGDGVIGVATAERAALDALAGGAESG